MSGKNLVVITPEKQAAAKAAADAERARLYDSGYAEGRLHGQREMLHTRPFLAAAALFAAVLVGGVIGAVAATRVYEQGAYTMGAIIGRIGQTQDTPPPSQIEMDPDAPRARDDCGYQRDARGQWKRLGDCNAQ